VAQETYLKYLAEEMGVPEETLRFEFSRQTGYSSRFRNKRKAGTSIKSTSAPPQVGLDSRFKAQYQREKEVLKLLLRRKEAQDFLLEELREDFFYHPENREVFLFLSRFNKEKSSLTVEINNLDGELGKKVSRLMLEEIYDDINIMSYAETLLKEIKTFFIQEEVRRLKKELEKLDPVEDSEQYDIIFKEIVQLERLRRNLN
jgi:DNA primase